MSGELNRLKKLPRQECNIIFLSLGRLAQLVEYLGDIERVVGSNPTTPRLLPSPDVVLYLRYQVERAVFLTFKTVLGASHLTHLQLA